MWKKKEKKKKILSNTFSGVQERRNERARGNKIEEERWNPRQIKARRCWTAASSRTHKPAASPRSKCISGLVAPDSRSRVCSATYKTREKRARIFGAFFYLPLFSLSHSLYSQLFSGHRQFVWQAAGFFFPDGYDMNHVNCLFYFAFFLIRSFFCGFGYREIGVFRENFRTACSLKCIDVSRTT